MVTVELPLENLLTSFSLSCKQGSSQHHFFRERERIFFFKVGVCFKDYG